MRIIISFNLRIINIHCKTLLRFYEGFRNCMRLATSLFKLYKGPLRKNSDPYFSIWYYINLNYFKSSKRSIVSNLILELIFSLNVAEILYWNISKWYWHHLFIIFIFVAITIFIRTRSMSPREFTGDDPLRVEETLACPCASTTRQ